ncbi:MAG: RNA polymerase sigma factor [Actinomycetota bacterium]
MREPDPDTIRRAQVGDLAAFEALVRETQADAWRLAFHLSRDRGVADDVTQEAFLRAYRSIESYRGDHQFSSWLLRIVRNCAMDAFQRSKRERLTRDRLTEEASLPPSRPGSSEDRLRIEQAVAGLPDQLREPFVLIDMLGFGYRDTSEILGVKIGTVKSRMHRAHAALMRLLAEEAAGEM